MTRMEIRIAPEWTSEMYYIWEQEVTDNWNQDWTRIGFRNEPELESGLDQNENKD